MQCRALSLPVPARVNCRNILNYIVFGLDVNAAAVVLEDKMLPICRNFARYKPKLLPLHSKLQTFWEHFSRKKLVNIIATPVAYIVLKLFKFSKLTVKFTQKLYAIIYKGTFSKSNAGTPNVF